MTSKKSKRVSLSGSKASIAYALAALLALGAIGGGVWLTLRSGALPTSLSGVLFPQASAEPLFNPGAGVSQEDGRELYRQALDNLQKGHVQEAIEGFQTLESVYPGLRDFALLHQSEAYTRLPDEAKAQERLETLLRETPRSPLRALALYQMAQSHFRAGEFDKAEDRFREVRKEFPDKPYAVGGLYYLGLLERRRDDIRKAVSHWMAYLNASPDGRFSSEIAEQLETLIPRPTPEQHQALGLGFVTGERHWDKAVDHLRKAPFREVWLPLAKAELKLGQNDTAVQTLVKGLRYAKDDESARTAVDLILANRPGDRNLAALKSLREEKYSVGGDYVLWKLAESDSSQTMACYQEIVSRYPKGNYAPESSWNLLWPLLRQRSHAAFLARSQVHMKRYATSKSAPKVMFWRAKSLEALGRRAEATEAYQETTRRYPNTYYAFRAESRLMALRDGRRDPGWSTAPVDRPYPPAADHRRASIVPPPETIGEGLHVKASELEAIGATTDLASLFKEILGEVPATVETWNNFEDDNRAAGIRVIRDYLEQRIKEGAPPTEDELKLMYPVYFDREIASAAPTNRLNPFLVQSLMREESYFNELAVSGSDARGLMQLLPSTARELAEQHGMSSFQTLDLFQPAVNVRLGAAYLGYLHRLFDGNGMLAVGAYNGGPNAMKRWLTQLPSPSQDPDLFVESIPYEQTRTYIKKVYTSFWNYNRLYPP